MVNVTSTPDGDLMYTLADGTTGVYNSGNIGYMLIATFQVMLMIPGLALFYSGLGRGKNATTQLWFGCSVMGMAMFQWAFWGFSLTFSPTGSVFLRDLKYFSLINVDIQPSTGSSAIPQLLYCAYQMMFAAITPVIAAGNFGATSRLLPVMIWTFCWQTVVYCPIAASTWNLGIAGEVPGGWLGTLGALDYAGGGPVHLASASAALAIAVFMGRRHGYGTESFAYRPHNITNVFLGTMLLFVGWLGFNPGSGLAANLRAVMAAIVTINAAIFGGFTWMAIDYLFVERKWSVVGFCSGVIAGLVAITPASGYVAWPASCAIGLLGAAAANFGTSFKTLIRVDDSLDIWASHGFAAITGALTTGLFADNRVASFDGSTPINGGWINRNFIQLGYQLVEVCFVFGWSFVVTMILLFLIDRIPGCHFRVSDEDEILGIDLAQTGEQNLILPRHFIDVEGESATPFETAPMLAKNGTPSTPSGSDSEHKHETPEKQPTSEIREAAA